MIGGSPIPMQVPMGQAMPSLHSAPLPGPMHLPAPMLQEQRPQRGAPRPPMPPPAPVASSQGWQTPPLPPPKVRGQSDEPTPMTCRLHLPAPEALGVGIASPSGSTPKSARSSSDRSASCDWSELHRRMDRLGVMGFHVERLEAGGFRVICLVPTTAPDRTLRVEALAATREEAALLAVHRAEQSRR